MPRLGFEPTIPEFERAKTVHALDRAATVIGCASPYTDTHSVVPLVHETAIPTYVKVRRFMAIIICNTAVVLGLRYLHSSPVSNGPCVCAVKQVKLENCSTDMIT
jgi:hypothetical protein